METKVEIICLDSNLKTPVDPQIVAKAIYVEDLNNPRLAEKIKVTGKYNREYVIVTSFTEIPDYRVATDGELLLVCMDHGLVSIDLQQDKLLGYKELDSKALESIFKFKEGFFLQGVVCNRYLNNKLEIVWESKLTNQDLVFLNPYCKGVELHDDFIVVADNLGDKYFYNEKGPIREEHYPHWW